VLEFEENSEDSRKPKRDTQNRVVMKAEGLSLICWMKHSANDFILIFGCFAFERNFFLCKRRRSLLIFQQKLVAMQSYKVLMKILYFQGNFISNCKSFSCNSISLPFHRCQFVNLCLLVFPAQHKHHRRVISIIAFREIFICC